VGLACSPHVLAETGLGLGGDIRVPRMPVHLDRVGEEERDFALGFLLSFVS
jgi:hypothetical protein